MKSLICKSLAVAVSLSAFCAFAGADAPKAEPIWPEAKMPGTSAEKDAYNEKGFAVEVKTPTMTFYKAELKSGKPEGLVIVCPGGGYKLLAYNYEGADIAKRLAESGVSTLLLKYRVPLNKEGALMDIQRAVRLARANAKAWNINPDKIAVMGFSAGANLCARASTLYNEKTYEPIDAADKLSARPDGTILVYPAYCDKPSYERYWGGKKKTEYTDYSSEYALADELKADKNTPPAFIVQTQDDKNYVNASIAYYLALKEAGVPANLHMFDKGGHGFGLRNKTDPVRQWINLLEEWLKANGYSAK